MNIAFRVDSSPVMGAGHFMRCFSLADILTDQGHHCLFVCSQLMPAHRAKLSDSGMEFFHINDDSDQNAHETIEILDAQACTALVVDHYELHGQWETTVLPLVATLAVIDDLVRNHVDGILIIDPTLGRKPAEYAASNPVTALCGSDYALLGKRYYDLREERIGGTGASKRNLLICFGGSLAGDLTLRTLTTLEENGLATFDQIDVGLPGEPDVLDAIRKLCDKTGAAFHDWVGDMPSMLADTTHAIGAPGGMAWERCVLGIPSIVVQIADNQTDNLAALEKAGVIERCSLDEVEAQLPMAMQNLDTNYFEMQRAALALVDGLGARRIAQYFSSDRTKDGQTVILRKAVMGDIETVYNWQCEPDARRFALNSEPPTWPEHESWMQDRIRRTTTHFHIVEYQGKPAGFVRLDRLEKKRYLISILISEKFQKLGIAGLALKRIEELHRELTICATVLPENISSTTLFLKAGYQQVSLKEYVRGVS